MMEEETTTRRDMEPIRERMTEEVPIGVQHPDLWMYQLSSMDTIDELCNLLRGNTWDRKNEKWVPQGKPLANEDGISLISTIVSSYLSKQKIVTKLTQAEIYNICREARLNMIHLLSMRNKEMGILKSHIDIVLTIVDVYIFTNITRSVEGMTLDAMTPSYKRIETITTPEKKKSPFSWIPFMKG